MLVFLNDLAVMKSAPAGDFPCLVQFPHQHDSLIENAEVNRRNRLALPIPVGERGIFLHFFDGKIANCPQQLRAALPDAD